MSKRWARVARSLLAAAAVVLAGALPSGAGAWPAADPAPLTLVSQTPSVSDTAPWFNLSFGVGEVGVPVDQLHLSFTFFGRIDDASQLQQAMAGTPPNRVLQRVSDVPVTAAPGGRSATTCVTVIPNSSVTPPAPTLPAAGGCTAISSTVTLDCTQDNGTCGGVYPVTVSLLRQGATSALARLTTFMTYEEASEVTGSETSGTGPLRVGWVVPVSGADPTGLIDTLSDHHQVPVTVAVSPRTVSSLQGHGRAGAHALAQLASGAAGDQVLGMPYVPIDVAALETTGLGGEIAAQIGRGVQLLRAGGLHPGGSTWVDTTTNLTASGAGALANGLSAARAGTLVLSDTDLSSVSGAELTLSQPFSLALPKAGHLTALAADSSLGSRFGALKADPVLAATQLLASLSLVHFEKPYLTDPRGVVLAPPAGWRPDPAFVTTLLDGLGSNPALMPVTLDQLVAQVPAGGNDEPSTRRLQSGAAGTGGLTRAGVARLTLARQHLASFDGAVAPGRPAVLTSLLDQLLASEASGLSPAARTAALNSYDRRFSHVLAAVTLATEHTVTFTARTAPIPVTVLSSAPYPVTVVLSVQSDKFTFPGGGGSRTLHLDRPTTPVRVQASARTSGDRLPVEVTLRTPDGQLVIARTTLTVHSTSISIVGIALTVLALLVLLMWWGRTWKRSRQHRPRAH